ncbi:MULTISPECIES: hypothetical protein [Nocardia]|uniref:hypothetical protein n=1 Tax=Nocardia TaxID=1817 RepID=UPI0006F24209|nr:MULTISPECIES: hypothetical protein [Nocardia]KQY38605.1 hypothetical protein ASD42_09485 [Nocardia sp. Root136]
MLREHDEQYFGEDEFDSVISYIGDRQAKKLDPPGGGSRHSERPGHQIENLARPLRAARR